MEIESEKYFKKFRLHIEKYVHIEDAEFDSVCRYFEVEKVSRKTCLLEPGKICRFENFVVSGLFQTTVSDESGKTHTLNFPHEDWWVGDFKSFSYWKVLQLSQAISKHLARMLVLRQMSGLSSNYHRPQNNVTCCSTKNTPT